ncbi:MULTISPECIES: Hint domain-containing protein [unclassified Ruegeria]|uniref:Hint domain-containing protein n=1 Tax=unclassified Ruegeria TaxID=2625375 RepID=UPI0014928723|nr:MULTISPECIES: Hint domain-containing protein [unclassified Ruegeria]NOD89515.1 hemolysin [Ruegeria sp. HKCCD4318]NOE13838.1 hemolysin [Ruegeria sp. HKCCD4318-2]NOG08227.1 hemolysin [Ruegeria sp. HKCCD4315]
MALTELIVGGDFQSPGITGPFQIFSTYGAWFGNEIEIGQESLFFTGGDPSDLVLELDGNAGPTSVVQQSFVVAGDNRGATLSFDIGARNTGGVFADPVLVEVVDSSNTVIFQQVVTPTTVGSFTNVSLNFNFGAEGTYTLRFTEQGPNNSLGTILDNVSLMVCFTSGTRIKTPDGEVDIDDLSAGDLVSTLDGEPQAIRWIGSKKLSRLDLIANPKIRPIRIRKGALGLGMPATDLTVSPQHRLLVRSKVAQRVLGEAEILVPAKKLTGLQGIERVEACEEVEYFHFALEDHSIVVADGAYAESLYIGPEAMKMLSADAIEELECLFPDLLDETTSPTPARPFHAHGKHINRLCQRLIQNKKPVVEASA